MNNKKKRGLLTGGYAQLEDKILAQDIQKFIHSLNPLMFYFLHKESNSICLGFHKDQNEGAVERVIHGISSAPEIFEPDYKNIISEITNGLVFWIKIKPSFTFKK